MLELAKTRYIQSEIGSPDKNQFKQKLFLEPDLEFDNGVLERTSICLNDDYTPDYEMVSYVLFRYSTKVRILEKRNQYTALSYFLLDEGKYVSVVTSEYYVV